MLSLQWAATLPRFMHAMILWYGELDAMAHEVADKVRDSAHTSLYMLLARHCQSRYAMNFACLLEGGTSLMAASLGRACRKAWD